MIHPLFAYEVARARAEDLRREAQISRHHQRRSRRRLPLWVKLRERPRLVPRTEAAP